MSNMQCVRVFLKTTETLSQTADFTSNMYADDDELQMCLQDEARKYVI